MERLSQNLMGIKGRILAACARCNREPSEIQVLYATKHATAQEIAKLLSLEGKITVGESRVQDAQEKFSELQQLLPPASFARVEKHMIGTLQSNKVKKAVQLFGCIQSVDSIALAEKIGRCAGEMGKTMAIFVEVSNGEKSKRGVPLGEADGLLSQLGNIQGIRVLGLMGMGVEGDEKKTREFFRGIRQKCRQHGLKASIGMSGDFEIAIEEGSNMLRLGRAIFGK